MTYALTLCRAHLTEATEHARQSETADLPQHAARSLALAGQALDRAFVVADSAGLGDEIDAPFASATAAIGAAAAALARACQT